MQCSSQFFSTIQHKVSIKLYTEQTYKWLLKILLGIGLQTGIYGGSLKLWHNKLLTKPSIKKTVAFIERCSGKPWRDNTIIILL